MPNPRRCHKNGWWDVNSVLSVDLPLSTPLTTLNNNTTRAWRRRPSTTNAPTMNLLRSNHSHLRQQGQSVQLLVPQHQDAECPRTDPKDTPTNVGRTRASNGDLEETYSTKPEPKSWTTKTFTRKRYTTLLLNAHGTKVSGSPASQRHRR